MTMPGAEHLVHSIIEILCTNPQFSCISIQITSAIIASERSGVECARDEIYAHSEITIMRI